MHGNTARDEAIRLVTYVVMSTLSFIAGNGVRGGNDWWYLMAIPVFTLGVIYAARTWSSATTGARLDQLIRSVDNLHESYKVVNGGQYYLDSKIGHDR